MAQASQFVISEFTNPSGEIVFRVTGWLDGKRIRKNFPPRVEASAERQALEIQPVQAETGIRTASTFLNDDQLREAEATFRRLADAPKSLSFYLDFALANYRAPDREQSLADAVTTYLAFKQCEHDQKLLSISQLDHIRRHLDVLKKRFLAVLVSQLTTQQLTAHCQRGNACPKTINNRRGILHMSRVCPVRVWQGGRLFRVIITGTGRKCLHTLKAISHPDEIGRPCLTIYALRRGLVQALRPSAPSSDNLSRASRTSAAERRTPRASNQRRTKSVTSAGARAFVSRTRVSTRPPQQGVFQPTGFST